MTLPRKSWLTLLTLSALLLSLLVCGVTPLRAASAPSLSATLPQTIKARGKLIVGVKCDYPPFGFVDADGKHAGFEIDVARRLAYYAFGNADAADLECVTGPNRIPYLTSDRADLIVSVLSWTPDRAKIVAFSTPYFDSSVRMIVPKDSTIKGWADVRGKTVTTTSGGTPAIWLTKCMPDVHQLLFDNTADSISALNDGRAVAYSQDMTLLVGITSKNPSFKIVGEGVARGPFGVGIKLGNEELIRWVNAALADMTKEDFFWKSLQQWVPKDDLASFSNAVPRPGRPSISYAEANDIYKCYGF